MKMCKRIFAFATVMTVISTAAHAQGVADSIKGLGPVLDGMYDKMMPLCGQLTGAARGIAGFAALWYIASRVWRSLANAEPIDFYPLFRPFVLGFCIGVFPLVMGLINAVLQPTVTATQSMVANSDNAIDLLLKQKQAAIKSSKFWEMYVGQDNEGSKDKWLRYIHDTKDDEPTPSEGVFEGIGSDISFAMSKAAYNFKNSVKEVLSEILSIVFEAVSLAINTIRIFQMVILSILGPFVFAIAVFDGLQHTLTAWLARYINVFLWLPVCNILGAMLGQIQQEMLKIDLSQINNTGDTFFSQTDIAYIVFLIMGIVSYVTVPTIAGHIVQAGGAGALTQKITSLSFNTATGAGNSAMAGINGVVGAMTPEPFMVDSVKGRSDAGGGQGARENSHMADKIAGNK